ncbi:hypothetical protein HYY73_01775 [Candidatus Woesearchaeota archaeon]|nr:hypothetical protein [Candidatus Woesearchaeota archaeon]
MRIAFERFDKDWILPVEGTLGNKAQNLFANREAIAAAGFRRPEAVVVPWEYLKAAPDPSSFVLSVIDTWLSGWQRVYVRSNAPDEDTDRRIPGLYSTEHIWNEDRAYAETLVERVLDSYGTVVARRSRKMRGVQESEMGLLLERAVSDANVDYAGSYTEFGDSSKVLFAWPEYMHLTMTRSPMKSYSVTDGRIQADHTPEEGEIARRLDDLVTRLVHIEGKGWEIEFLVHKGEMYAAQVTPVIMHPQLIMPNGVQSVFEVGQVVGTGDYSLDGVLWTSPFPGEGHIQALEKFDSEHANYAVITEKLAINSTNRAGGQLFMSLLNARAFLITNIWRGSSSLASHVEQYLRNTGVALEIRESLDLPLEPAYSPTKLRVVADESSGKGVVILDGSWQPYEKLALQP